MKCDSTTRLVTQKSSIQELWSLQMLVVIIAWVTKIYFISIEKQDLTMIAFFLSDEQVIPNYVLNHPKYPMAVELAQVKRMPFVQDLCRETCTLGNAAFLSWNTWLSNKIFLEQLSTEMPRQLHFMATIVIIWLEDLWRSKRHMKDVQCNLQETLTNWKMYVLQSVKQS